MRNANLGRGARMAPAVVTALAFLAMALPGCRGGSGPSEPDGRAPAGASGPGGTAGSDPDEYLAAGRKRPSPSPTATSSPIPAPSPTGSASPAPTEASVDALIFNGAGTSASDTESVRSIAASHGLSYQVVTSAELEALSVDQLARFRVILWPGGDSNVMSANLSGAARARVRSAVLERGVSYVGFCAGAWMAVGPAPASGAAPIWGLSIVAGDYLKEYLPNGQEPVAAMVRTSFADGSSRDLVWWGGPYLPSYAGQVVGKYPDGSAAMLEARAGLGYVALSGPHPEAPLDWRTGAGLQDSDGLDFDVAWGLIDNALRRTGLTAF